MRERRYVIVTIIFVYTVYIIPGWKKKKNRESSLSRFAQNDGPESSTSGPSWNHGKSGPHCFKWPCRMFNLSACTGYSYHPPHHQHLYYLINLQQSQLQDHLFPLPLVSHTLEPPIPDEVQPTENAELDYLKGLDFSVRRPGPFLSQNS